MNAVALTASEVGDLYWLIGWCVLFICVAAVVITAIVKGGF